MDALASRLQRLIRYHGRRALAEMKAIRAETTAPSGMRSRAIAAVSVADPIEALRNLGQFALEDTYAGVRRLAEMILARPSIMRMMSNAIIDNDGRIVGRIDDSSPPIFGHNARLWEEMVSEYQMSCQNLFQISLGPAFQHLVNEHHYSDRDLLSLVGESALLPHEHHGQHVAILRRGLSFDFGGAVHLLAPAVELFVRRALQEAGEITSVIDERGIESEVGLSKLMVGDAADRVFGEDLAFSIRAIYCGPTGPNLRNSVAHGLLTWEMANSVISAFAWTHFVGITTTVAFNRARPKPDPAFDD